MPTGLTANRVGQGPSIPRMRFLILAAALACTASPALGQVRQELRERGKLGNVSAPNPPRTHVTISAVTVPQNDAEGRELEADPDWRRDRIRR